MTPTEPPSDKSPPGSAYLAGADDIASAHPANPTVFNSQCLLRGLKEAWIEHNGVTYRLQATRQGKLILTK